ncbi:hypothetical protein AB1N83_010037 [Pleurotus pulmonarius]
MPDTNTSQRVLAEVPASFEIAVKHGFEGDVFVEGQKGGIAGGHANVNELNKGQVALKTRLVKLRPLAKPETEASDGQYSSAIGELVDLGEEIEKLSNQTAELLKACLDRKKELDPSD